MEKKQPLRYIASMAMLFLFGNLKFLRVSARFLDYHLVRDKRLDKYFKKYKPNLVFTSNIIVPLDRSFLRHAKKRGVRTVGMINSWDNITLSKYPFRILPNHLVVHNAIIKDEAVKYLDIPKEKIFISGLPHFDFYVTGKRSTREEFCTNLGISSDKRIILFASIGSSLNPTERQVLSLLDDAIVKEKLPKDMVIIFRQHPTEKTLVGDTNKSSNIIIDDSKTILTKENSYSEILTKDMEHLADSIFHSDVMINTASTMSIDASVFDKPVINIAFDGWEEKQFHESVSRFYKPSHAHYQPIVKSGGVRITYSIDDLIEVINLYLNDPTLDKKGRRRIVEEQCYKLDGQSGKRIGIFLLSLIKN
ncbi:MAG TPA: hypothetical protein ENI76_07410 [Ignavibacteria bacterium]|nr:hypothetical protein [Ignavibacteria bacterium]